MKIVYRMDSDGGPTASSSTSSWSSTTTLAAMVGAWTSSMASSSMIILVMVLSAVVFTARRWASSSSSADLENQNGASEEPLVGPKAHAIKPKKENSNTTSTRMSSASMSSSSATAPISAAAETKTQGYMSEITEVSPTLHLHGTHVETHNVGVQVSQPQSVAQLPLQPRACAVGPWKSGKAFHRRTCGMVRRRLLDNPSDVRELPEATARNRGLRPCRQRNPDL